MAFIMLCTILGMYNEFNQPCECYSHENIDTFIFFIYNKLFFTDLTPKMLRKPAELNVQ